MIEYTFKNGPFYFHVMAENDKDAVTKARRAIEETAPVSSRVYLKVDLDAGGFGGRIYMDPQEITVSNIRKRESVPEVDVEVPF